MNVEIKPYRIIDLANRQERDGGRYRIFVDEKFVGLVEYCDGARPMLHVRFNPLELQEIESELNRLLAPQTVGACVQPGAAPSQPKKQSVIYTGDFD